MDCAELADAAPELALELLTGEQRADALVHLDRCSSCQELVSSLTAATDRLLVRLTPAADPPIGFEDRILAALDDAIEPLPSLPMRRRRPLVALAMAACVALLVAVISLGPSARPALAVADMHAAGGTVVGQVYVRRDTPPALFMTLPGWADALRRHSEPGEAYALRLDIDDGTVRTVPITTDAGSSWAVTLAVDPDTITTLELVDRRGYVWCWAELD